MPNYCIVHERPEDGGVAVDMVAEAAREFVDVYPEYPYPSGPHRPETDLELHERAATILGQRLGRTMMILTTKDLPPNKNFRDAWRFDAALLKVKVDMPKARELHRQNLRWLRQVELDRLDIEYQRADETGDVTVKAQIVQQKQALRNLPQDPAIDSAATPEELKALWPSILPNPYV